ncbi:RNA polymerase sigma factor [Phenylobacterium sp. VNQ135]|uniref:RNA polymerase sigma factor n=1 Tax=Phenylobacterium sp. VNQ135 TaxID=3400922 RepID=UPI003C020661
MSAAYLKSGGGMAISGADYMMRTGAERTDAIAFMPALKAFFRHKAHGDDVEDLIQEVLIRMHGRRVAEIENYECYVFRVARNVLRDRYRRDHVRRRSDHCELQEQDHPPDDMSPERILFGREQLQSALEAMSELPERSRRILVLLRWEGMSYSEVAELLDISVSAVQKHVTRSMRHLMTRLLESHDPHVATHPEDERGGRRRRVRVVRPAAVAPSDARRRACC